MAMPAMAPPERDVPSVEPVAGAALPLRSAIELAAGTVIADESNATEMNVAGADDADDDEADAETEADTEPLTLLALAVVAAPIVTCWM